MFNPSSRSVLKQRIYLTLSDLYWDQIFQHCVLLLPGTGPKPGLRYPSPSQVKLPGDLKAHLAKAKKEKKKRNLPTKK